MKYSLHHSILNWIIYVFHLWWWLIYIFIISKWLRDWAWEYVGAILIFTLSYTVCNVNTTFRWSCHATLVWNFLFQILFVVAFWLALSAVWRSFLFVSYAVRPPWLIAADLCKILMNLICLFFQCFYGY